MQTLIAGFKRRFLLLIFLIVGLQGVILATLWMLMCILFSPNGKRAWHIAIGFDQLANATTGGNEDETISSRAGRLKREGRGWACVLCRLLDWLQKDHCSNSAGK